MANNAVKSFILDSALFCLLKTSWSLAFEQQAEFTLLYCDWQKTEQFVLVMFSWDVFWD